MAVRTSGRWLQRRAGAALRARLWPGPGGLPDYQVMRQGLVSERHLRRRRKKRKKEVSHDPAVKSDRITWR